MVHRQTIQARNFDSVLHPALPGKPARLNIRLKATLFAKDPTASASTSPGVFTFTHRVVHDMSARTAGLVLDGSGRPWRCCTWLEAEFNAFKIEFKRVVERAWNDQLILVPPDGSEPGEEISDATYREFINAPNIPAHVRCGLEIALVPNAPGTSPHALIEVARLEPSSGHQFRSFMMLMTNEDVEVSHAADHTGHIHSQVTAAHEVGHWLGRPVSMTTPGRFLDHIDFARCAAADPQYQPNDDCEYGWTLTRRKALMGLGSLVTDYEAKPWLTRARRHTRVLFGWDVVHRVDFLRTVRVSERQRRLVAAATRH